MAACAADVRKDHPHLVIIHVGNNERFAASDLGSVMSALCTTPLVVFVTVDVARSWETADNRMVRPEAIHYRNVVIAHWHAVTADSTGAFSRDGIHVNATGAKMYAAMLIQAIGTFGAPKPPAGSTPPPTPHGVTPPPRP